ncbi:MAG: tRNA (adenosine(37)-N6)-threonylcarbamoyltransferase complex transferase subunit TsaD, partial [Ileibacterium sp.]|nr:tRNA (adenosine(37)-N6)-threonylcarbamoyltransferase complex transferase subunit TsaD [Ileibacterium sp.]
MIVLGIESSCDETAAAVVKDKKEILSSVVASQIDTHKEFGGVVPEVASRIHVENISYVIEKAVKDSGLDWKDIDAIAVTQGPGLIGCLHVGVQAAKTLALLKEKPLVPVNHLAAHIYANEMVVDMEYPVMALLVSGGNSELIYMTDPHSFEILGETQDDAIGEAYDKVARVLNLGYPGGP